MSTYEQTSSEPGFIRTPRLTQMAGNLVAALEAADPSNPVNLNIAGDPDKSFVELLDTELAATDAVYDRHRHIFRPGNIPIQAGQLDLKAVLDNTAAALENIKPRNEKRRGVALGLAAAELGELALAVADQPELLTATPSADTEAPAISSQTTRSLPAETRRTTAAMTARYGNIAEAAFQATIAPKVRGNINLLPNYLQTYPGYPLQAYYRFWDEYAKQIDIPPDIQTRLDKQLNQFPSKIANFDTHTLNGRPDTADTRRDYLDSVRLFRESLAFPAPNSRIGNNFEDALNVAFLAYEATEVYNLSTAERLGMVALHCATLGRVTQRASIDQPIEGSMRFTGPPQNPELVIGHPTDVVDTPSITLRKVQKGGICPARNVVAIPTDGRVHRGSQAISQMLNALELICYLHVRLKTNCIWIRLHSL